MDNKLLIDIQNNEIKEPIEILIKNNKGEM